MPTPAVPYKDRGYASSEEWFADVEAIEALNLNSATKDEFKYRQPKGAVASLLATQGGTPPAPPKPAPTVPDYLPTGRAPRSLTDVQADLARGQKAIDEAEASLYTPKAKKTPEEEIQADQARMVQAARILSRPRDPEGDVVPGWWESFSKPNPESWDITNALRPQVLLDPNQTEQTKDESKGLLQRLTTEETSGPHPATIESPVGTLLRWMAVPTSGAVGVVEDLAHAVGLGNEPESGGVAERIKQGGGLSIGARDLADYMAPEDQDSFLGGKALPPQPTEGRPTQEWMDWYGTRFFPAEMRAPEPTIKPSPEWLAWKDQFDIKNNTRSQAMSAGMALGLIGDLAVPIDLGVGDYAQAAKAVRATRLAEAGVEGARELTTGGRVYAAILDAMEPLAAKGRQLREEGVLKAATTGFTDALGDPRLVAVERVARGAETQRAAKAWSDAIAEATAKDSPTLATADAKVAETWGRMGLPTQTADATKALEELRSITGKALPDPIDIARASVGARLVEAARLPARFTQRIGDVAVPASKMQDIREAIRQTPAGKAAETVRSTLTRGKGGTPPVVTVPNQILADVSHYMADHGLLEQAPNAVQGLKELRGAEVVGRSRIPAAEWNQILKLTAEAEASRLVPGFVERGRTILPAAAEGASEQATRLTRVFTPKEVRPGVVEQAVTKGFTKAREALASTVAPVKHTSPVLTEWMDRTMARMASVDESLKARVRGIRANQGGTQAEAYAAEFGDAWHPTDPAMGGVVDQPRMVTDIVSGAYGSVLGVGNGISNGMDAGLLYRMVGALTRTPETALSKINTRFAGLTGVDLYQQAARLAALPGASGRVLADFIPAEDIAKLKADAAALYQWDLTPAQVDAAYARMSTLTPRVAPQDAQELLSTLHVGRRAEQVAQESVGELQAMMPLSIPSQGMLRTVITKLNGAFEEALGGTLPASRDARALSQAMLIDFQNAVTKELQQGVNLPNPTAVPNAYEPVSAATRSFLGPWPMGVDYLVLDTEIQKMAKAYISTLEHDIGGVVTKAGAQYVVEELSAAIKQHIAPQMDMPLRASDALRHQSFLILENPAIEARMQSLAGFTALTEGLKDLPRPPASMLSDLQSGEIVQGLDRMKGLAWADSPWSTAPVRWLNTLRTNIVPTAKGLTRSGMLGGFILPNIGYHVMNMLSAPAIIWQTIGGKAAARSLLSTPESFQALRYYYGYVGGMNNVDGLQILFRTPDGVAYTTRDIAEIIAKESISKSQASFELSNGIAKDVTKWTGMSMTKWYGVTRGTGPEAVGWIRNHIRRYWDPRRSNLWNEMATAMDNTNRTNVLISSLKAGRTEEEAVQLARASLFDYGNLTDFERKYIAHNVLFYSFLRHNVVTTTKALLSNPSRALHLLRLTQGLPEEITGQDGETTFARHFNTNAFTDSRPFLTHLQSQDAKRRFALYGPPIPFADALSSMYGWAAMFNPMFDNTLKSGIGPTASNVAIEAVSHLGPYTQAALSAATGQTFSFGERRETGTYLNPKLLYWMTLNPLAWETFKANINVEVVPADELDPYKSVSVNGLSYRIANNDTASIQTWQIFQNALMAIGVQRLAQDAAPWLRGEDYDWMKGQESDYDNPPTNAEPGSAQYRQEVANYQALHRTPVSLEVPHDLAISRYSSPYLYEVLRNLGVITVQPELKNDQELQNRQDNRAMQDAGDYPQRQK